ncbi:MAG TPA: hypothetical protein VND65_12410 [Candidatus Binatia bacterium]|nr:hypothetical protein [Candidatus Binatia bacterium]
MPENPATAARPYIRRVRPVIIAAALLLFALALVVIYTGRRAFSSPLAVVVLAAIGMAALLLQLRMNPEKRPSSRSGTWLIGAGGVFAIAAVVADLVHARVTLLTSLAAVVLFSLSAVLQIKSQRGHG